MTLNDRLEAFFKERPLQWIDGKQLAEVAGGYAWRSRVSDLRTQGGLKIDNRVRVVKPGMYGAPGSKVSEYRYTPAKPARLF